MIEYLSSTAYMFQAILASLALALLAGPFSIRLAQRFGLMDMPGSDPRKQHQRPTPLAGGMVVISVLVVLVIVTGLLWEQRIFYLMLAALVIFVFGVWDDRKKLTPAAKLAGQLAAAIILNLGGIYVQFFESGTFFFGSPLPVFVLLDRLVTILWVIGVTNAFNLVDSMDGLAAGLGAWTFGFFMLATFDSQQFELSLFSAILLGICLGLGYYNASPARFFLGDAGALLLGFTFSAVAILYTPPTADQMSSWFVPILLVGVPIFDTTLVFFSRLRRGRPFYKGDRDHTYHRLVILGLEPGRAVMTMHLTAVLLECVAFLSFSMTPFLANFIFAGCLGLGGVLLLILDDPRRWP